MAMRDERCEDNWYFWNSKNRLFMDTLHLAMLYVVYICCMDIFVVSSRTVGRRRWPLILIFVFVARDGCRH